MKKKKKTLYIRRVRINLKKKKSLVPFQAESFSRRFNYIFRRKINILKKKSFIRFINLFESTNFHKVFNFIKYFGMNKSYRFFNFKHTSKKSKYLILKIKNSFKNTKYYKKIMQKRKKRIIQLKIKIKKSNFYKKRIAHTSLENRNKFIRSKINKKIKRNRKYRKEKKDVEVLKSKFIVFFHQKIKFRSMRMKNIKFKEKLCLYFSYRHMMYLPVRGQRTKTNAKTRKDFYVR